MAIVQSGCGKEVCMVRGVNTSLLSNKVPRFIVKKLDPKNLKKTMDLPAKIAMTATAALGVSVGKNSLNNEMTQKNGKLVTSYSDHCHSDYWCGLAFP